MAERPMTTGEALMAKVGRQRKESGVRPEVTAPDVMPPLPPMPPVKEPGCTPGLYQVTTGVAPLKKAPKISSPGLALLKGGHRFYAVPYEVGGHEWLKLESEDVAAPLFSSVGFELSKSKHEDKLAEMYWRSIPSLVASCPNLTGDMWIRNEAKTLKRLRAARLSRPFSALEANILEDATPAPSSQRLQEASESMIKRFKPPRENQHLKEWVRCGGGSWTNFREYGPLSRPPNDNCGRWRQLPDRPVKGNA
ncbi:unnamed protein product [Effrenium voratum]|nr:unnamed protein product [Effrenium voratum]